MGKTSNQQSANGWTDEYTITYEDFSVASAGTLADRATLAFTYAVPIGSQVRNVAAHLVTAFDDSGGGDQLNFIVGDGSDADGYLTTAVVHVDETEITYVANTGALLDNENGVVYTVADTIDILFTPDAATGTPYSLNELTAGKIVFKFDIAQI
tara:strand:+ start:40 stop:501 length:462 start_codon:yes stop_codon:yes gene_type:complete